MASSAPTEAELHHKYARKLKQTFERAYSTAREHVGTAVERAKEIYTMHGACMCNELNCALAHTKVQVYGMTDRIYIFVMLYCNCHFFCPIITLA